MVLALARPDVDEQFPELWQARAPQVIRLGPLSQARQREAGARGAGRRAGRRPWSSDRRARRRQRVLSGGADPRDRRRAARESLPDSVLGMVQARLDAEGSEAKRVLRAASGVRRALLALRGGGAAGRRGRAGRRVATRSNAWRRASWSSRAATPEGRADAEFTLRARAGARGRLRDADRRRSARSATGWRARGWSRRGAATRWRWPSTSGAAASRRARCAGTSAPRSRRCGPTISAPRSSGPRSAMASDATAEAAGQLRLIQAEAHVWRGELDAALARALEAAASLAPGGAAWLRAQAQAIIAAAKHGRLDVVERQVGLVGETPCAPDPTARNAQVICLSWAANYLVFGGRTAAADALIAAHRRAGGRLRADRAAGAGPGAPGAGGARVGGGRSRPLPGRPANRRCRRSSRRATCATPARCAPTSATCTASSATSSAPRRRCARRRSPPIGWALRSDGGGAPEPRPRARAARRSRRGGAAGTRGDR